MNCSLSDSLVTLHFFQCNFTLNGLDLGFSLLSTDEALTAAILSTNYKHSK